MGEAKLTTPRSGQIELQKWFDQGAGALPIDGLARKIQPSQDMLQYQQRRFFMQSTLSVLNGFKANWLLTVPDDEAWEFDQINVIHGDTTKHTYQIQWFPPTNSPFGRLVLTARQIIELENVCLFPVRSLEGDITSSAEFEFIGRFKVGPRERIQIQSQTPVAAVGPIVEQILMRLHRIPVPVEQIERDLIVGTQI